MIMITCGHSLVHPDSLSIEIPFLKPTDDCGIMRAPHIVSRSGYSPVCGWLFEISLSHISDKAEGVRQYETERKRIYTIPLGIYRAIVFAKCHSISAADALENISPNSEQMNEKNESL